MTPTTLVRLSTLRELTCPTCGRVARLDELELTGTWSWCRTCRTWRPVRWVGWRRPVGSAQIAELIGQLVGERAASSAS